MDSNSILVIRVSDTAAIAERLGQAEAQHAVERCLKRVQRVTESSQGNIAACEGEEALAEFDSPDAALAAAAEMHARVGDLPPVAGRPLRIQIGLHHDSATDLARALAAGAQPGQTLLASDSFTRLAETSRAGLRQLQPRWMMDQLLLLAAAGGEAEPAAAPSSAAPQWNATATHVRTTAGDPPAAAQAAPAKAVAPSAVAVELILRCGESLVQLVAGAAPLQIGRDKTCGFRINDPLASRVHAVIEWRDTGFVLVDQSTNGTWLTTDTNPELPVRHGEGVLRGKGRISFGHPAREGGEAAIFLVKTAPR